MKRTVEPRWAVTVGGALVLGLLAGCGSSGGGGSAEGDLVARAVVGTVVLEEASGRLAARAPDAGSSVTVDDGSVEWPLDAGGHFEVKSLADGDHSLFLRVASGGEIEVPVRILAGRGLDLGEVRVRSGAVQDIEGFDGYQFGFIDADEDGLNDNCVDADGNSICDPGGRYAGYPFLMNRGFVDADGDGVNDNCTDADGDGTCDGDGVGYSYGFGYVDEDGDAANDACVDEEGDGICDDSRLPYRVDALWVDEDGDGENDTFADADGDGVNDRSGRGYVAMPGWVDEDADGVNDRFQDADGDGVCDLSGTAYAHGYGFVDANEDGFNDHYVDADGDSVNDLASGPYYLLHNRHGWLGPHLDQDGEDGVDGTGVNLRSGFGWEDDDSDGINDNFQDADGDGVDDNTGCCYQNGYGTEEDGGEGGEGGEGSGAKTGGDGDVPASED